MLDDRSKIRDGDMPLLDRVDAALRRVTNGEGQMRVPVEATDPDVVLFDCKHEIERLSALVARATGSAALCGAGGDGASRMTDDTPMILDACCGSRMMWFDRDRQDVIYGDRRSETVTVTDRSRGNASGTRTLVIDPDVRFDFRALPFADGLFRLVAFDPPHLVQAGPRSWLAAKYGKLATDWRDDLRAGFAECWRVLDSEGVLVFKWSEAQIKVSQVIDLAPARPLFGNTSGRRAGTHWMVFMKAPDRDDLPRA